MNLGSVSANAQTNQSTSDNESVDKSSAFKSALDKAEKKGKVKVIVGLETPFTPEGNLGKLSDKQNQRNAIKQSQDLLLQDLSSHDISSVKKFKYVPYLSMEVNSAALNRLSKSPHVKTIQEDVPIHPLLSDSILVTGTHNAWLAGYTGNGQTIAILDTGVESSHSFLTGKVVSEACYSTTGTDSTTVCPNSQDEQTGTGAGAPCSITGCYHGTFVAGIAAGKGTSFSGVAKDANIISIQVFSRFDDTTNCAPDSPPCVLSFTSDIIAGLERVYELRNTFTIASVNISIGGGQFTSACDTDPAKTIIDTLRSVNIATVIASGNDGFTNALGAPACISTAISVASTTKADVISSFSNTASFLDLLAPGESITSSLTGNAFGTGSGTSFAAPHVAGAWAVLKQRSTSASVDTILSDLVNTGTTIVHSTSGLSFHRIRVDSAAGISCSQSLGSSIYVCIPESTNLSDATNKAVSKSIAETIIISDPISKAVTKSVAETVIVSDSPAISPSCAPPTSGDWIITSSCTIISSATAPANVIVQNGAVLTVPNGVTLNVDFTTKYLLVKSGSGVLVKAGGKIF